VTFFAGASRFAAAINREILSGDLGSQKLHGRAATPAAQHSKIGFSYKDFGLFQNTYAANVLMVAVESHFGPLLAAAR